MCWWCGPASSGVTGLAYGTRVPGATAWVWMIPVSLTSAWIVPSR